MIYLRRKWMELLLGKRDLVCVECSAAYGLNYPPDCMWEDCPAQKALDAFAAAESSDAGRSKNWNMISILIGLQVGLALTLGLAILWRAIGFFLGTIQ